MLKSLFNRARSLQACNFTEKRLQRRCFPVEFDNFVRTPSFTEQLQWLFLRLTSCFQRSPKQKPMWQIYQRAVIPAFFFILLNLLVSRKWISCVTCYVKIFLLFFFLLKQFFDIYFIIRKLFYNLVHTSNEILSFL